MKRNTLSWLALVPSIVTLAAVYSILAWGEGQNIAAVLAGAASIVTTVVVVSIFAMQLVRDSRKTIPLSQRYWWPKPFWV